MYANVVVEIVEEPAELNERFRYGCEGKSAVLGANSTSDKRSYPAIRLLHYTGAAVVVVSCVSKDQPYRPHPHSLVGKGCCKGVCKIDFKTDESAPTVVAFKDMGIQCCRRNDIEKTLTERETLRIDPFKTGFKHKNDVSTDLTAVRLCFQVLLRSSENDDSKQGKLKPVTPVVSNIIRDKKFAADLLISDISDTTSPTTGGKKIVIFCGKVVKNDIKVRFFRENRAKNSVEWEGWGQFQPINVHRQVAIAFKTPAYATNDISTPVDVYLQLVRPSDGRRSEPIYFRYVPDYSNVDYSIRNKKRKILENEAFYQYVQERAEEQRHRSKMEININPNTEYNAVSYGRAEQPSSHCDGYGQLQQSHQIQQPYSYSQRVQPSCHAPNSSYYSQHKATQINYAQPPNNQTYHSYIDQPQLQNNYSDYQSLTQIQQPPQELNLRQNFHQPVHNFPLQKPQQQQQQQFQPQSKYQQMYANPDYGGPYDLPLPNHNNAEQVYDSKSQNAYQLCPTSDSTMMVNHQQITCERNFNAEDIIENMNDSFGSLLQL